MIHVEKFSYLDIDDLNANSYVVSDINNHAIVIDPSVDNDGLINYINKHGLTLVAILLTHGHFDHIRGVDRLVNYFHVPVYIHNLDECMLYDSYLNGSNDLGEELIVNSRVNYLKDKDTLKLLNEDIEIIHTPFHTKGGVCFYFKESKILFSGDTLFKGSIGRDDLPNAIPSLTYESLNKLKRLPKECKVYPGHGGNTTIGDELNYNYFLSH